MTRARSRSSRRLRRAQRPDAVSSDALSQGAGAYPEAWERGVDIAALPSHSEHIAQLSAIAPSWATYYARAASGLLGSDSEPELLERQTMILGRERGHVT